MTDREWDAVLRQGLILANSPERLNLPEEPFPESETYQRRMANMLKNPFKYARKARRAARPMWKKALSNVAMLLIVLSVSFAAVMAVSPTARAFVHRVVTEWMKEYVSFRFTGEEAVTNDVWRPTWLPEGFRQISAFDEDGYGKVIFENNDDLIYFDYRPIVSGNQFNMDYEHSEVDEFLINGQSAYLFLSNSVDIQSYIVWVNEEENTAFRITGDVEKEVFIQIIESIKK